MMIGNENNGIRAGNEGDGERSPAVYREMCERIVQKALEMGADSAETVVMGGKGISFSFEKNSINKSSGSSDFGIGIRLLKNRRIGFSYCSREEDAVETIGKALQISKIHELTEFTFPGNQPGPGPSRLSRDDIYDERIPEIDAATCLDFLEDMMNAAHEVKGDILTSGGVYCGEEFFALANSSGNRSSYEKTFLGGSISTILKQNGKMTSASDSLESLHTGPDFSELGTKAAELAVSSLNQKSLDRKVDTILFTPETISSFFEFIIAPAVFGKKALRSESVYSGKVGDVVTSEDLSIIDTGVLRGGVNSAPYDDEGVMSQENTVVDQGVLRHFLFDGLNAVQFNTTSTGNGLRAGRLMTSHSSEAPVDTAIRNLTLKGHNGKGMEFDELVAGVRKGIYVHDTIGAHTANPSSGDFTISSLLLFEIVNGEIGRALKPVNIRGNFPSLLKNFVGHSRDYKHVSGGLTAGGFYMPHVVLEGFTVY